MNLEVNLAAHMRRLGYEISSKDTQSISNQLVRYLGLITKWNRVHNLTSIRIPEDMLTCHIMDSLAVLPRLDGNRVADVGSGAGLPGVPIAVARPDWQVALIESNQKKAAFLQQVKVELELNNVYVYAGRAEDYMPDEKFDIVISRALSSLQKFVLLAGHLCDESRKDSRLVAMKGAKPEGERSQLPANYFVEKILPITVPGLDAKRQLVIINKKV